MAGPSSYTAEGIDCDTLENQQTSGKIGISSHSLQLLQLEALPEADVGEADTSPCGHACHTGHAGSIDR